MAFKKLDSDLVDNTLMRPVDAFTLQGIDANNQSAWAARGRSAAQGYGADSRPTLATIRTSGVPLTPWVVSPTATALTLTLRGIASATGGGSAVHFRLVAMTMGGRFLDDFDMTTVGDDASVQQVTATLNVRSASGQPVVLWLVFESELLTATATSDGRTPSDLSVAGFKIDIGATLGASYDSVKRYQLAPAEDSSGTIPEEPLGYVGASMIVNDGSSNDKYVLPRFGDELLSYSQFDLVMTELGRMELYGWSIEETGFDAPASLVPALRSGSIPRARAFQALYGQQHSLAFERTRVCHVGGSPAFEDMGRYWGAIYSYDEAQAEDCHCAAVGDLPTYKVDTRTATTVYRRRYRALALVCAATTSPSVESFKVDMTAQIASFSGGVWSTSTVTPTVAYDSAVVTPLQAVILDPGVTADRIFQTFSDGHHLDGTWDWAEVKAGKHGLSIIDAIFEEAEAQQTATERLLTLRMTPTDVSPPVADDTDLNHIKIYHPCALVMIDEGP